MERKTVSQAPIYVRDALNRAAKCAAAGDFDNAIMTLLPVIRNNPAVAMLYDKIREYELGRLRAQGGGVKFLAGLFALFKVPVIRIVGITDPVKAMAMCESSLAFCVDNSLMLSTLAAVARAADAPWAEATSYMVLNKLHPIKSPGQLRNMAEAMQRNGQALDALKIQHDMVSKQQVKTLADKSDLRSAMALASIERGKFNNKKSNKANTADAEDAVIQQLLDGTIHDASQAQLLIEKFTAELRKNDSIDMRRKLAEAYMVAEKYEDALREYRSVAEKVGVTDPVLDKHIEKAYIAQLNEGIKQLRATPESFEEPEAQIAELEEEIASYRWRHAVRRAEMFPNDMQLQFDLGELQFERNMIDEAIATFTAVAENPQKRRGSLVYLGRCALLKNDAARAVELLSTAVNDMARMDKYKREALYYLGNAREAVGDSTGAFEAYRQISVSMENYRDVPQRMSALQGAMESK